MTAAIEGSMKMVKLLLDHNSNVDLKDEKERNALHYAANHDNPELLKVPSRLIIDLLVFKSNIIFVRFSFFWIVTLTKAPWRIKISRIRLPFTLLSRKATWRPLNS